MSTEDLHSIFAAEPDPDYYKRRGSWGGKGGSAVISERGKREIYVHGDERVSEDGRYLRIVTEEGYVYLARDMIERLSKMLQGGDEFLDF